MKQLVRIFVLATGLGALGTSALAQQGVSLATGFTDFTSWTLLGSATAQNDTPGNGFTYSNLILTAPGSSGKAGAGFAPSALTIDFNQAFQFDFHFFIPPSNGVRGDGLTFVLAGSPGLGNGGSGLGYDGLGAESVAFAIDTFNFEGEYESPSLQILVGGNVDLPWAATETGLGDTIRDPDFQWYAQVSYTPSGNNIGTLTGQIEHPILGNFNVSTEVDFSYLSGKPVYYGFTAANGLATDGHFVTSAAPVPEPHAALLMLAGGMLLAGWARWRKG